MIRDMLSVLPTRPVVYIAPLLVVAVLSFYYWDLYAKCADSREFRLSFNDSIAKADDTTSIRLTEFTNFFWDKVRIVINFQPERRSTECLFGWNWPDGERDALIASGQLTALIFADQGLIVRYHELDSNEISFRGVEASITRESAVFGIVRETDAVTLTLKK